MTDRYGPYDPLFLCIWDNNLALYGYLYIFFHKLLCKLHDRKSDILKCFFFFNNKKDLVSHSYHLSFQKTIYNLKFLRK